MAPGPITLWHIEEGESGGSNILFWGAPKSLQMETAAMKIKDVCSLKGKPSQI